MKQSTFFKDFFNNVLKGFLGLLPIVVIVIIVKWVYDKINGLVNWIFSAIGFNPQEHYFLWFLFVVGIFLLLLYFIGYLMNTRLARYFERLLQKIPGYSTIKDIVSIFVSSKEGKHRVLVVIIKGFGCTSYNIGVMYSQKESIVKDHYTVSLSMSPLPNGGFMFEVHKKEIYVIEDATFDNYLKYLLSMGVKSFAQIIGKKPRDIESLPTLETWLEKNPQTKPFIKKEKDQNATK